MWNAKFVCEGDMGPAVKALKRTMKGTAKERIAMVVAGEILNIDANTASGVVLDLDSVGIKVQLEEIRDEPEPEPVKLDPDVTAEQIADRIVAEDEAGPMADPQADPLDEKAARVVELVTRLLTLEADSPEARLKAWLEVAEAETDPVILAAVAVKVGEAGVDAVLGQVICDRIAVIQRAPETAPGGPVVVGEWKKQLQCPLSDTEIAHVMREVSPLRRALVDKLEGLTRQVKACKADIETCLRRYDLAGEGVEERPVQGRSILVGDEVHEIRDDTGEVVERRPPTDAERQVLLFPSTPTLDNPPPFDPDDKPAFDGDLR